MLDAPERVGTTADEAEHPTPKVAWWRSLHATSTRRALLLTALGGLLIAGVLTALPGTEGAGGMPNNAIQLGLRGAETFGNAKAGECLNWPEGTPDDAKFGDCGTAFRVPQLGIAGEVPGDDDDVDVAGHDCLLTRWFD